MQTVIPHTPAHAQHVPNVWEFPTLSAPVPPPAAAPVSGGGPSTTATRVRWGRILLVAAGVALVAFGAWRATSGGPDGSAARSVAGGGTSEVEVAPADEANADPAAIEGVTPDVTATPAAPARVATPRPARRAGAGAGRRPARRAAGIAGAAGLASAPANAAPATGGGAGPSGQLPVTGLETWIAAGLGLLVLALGIAIQVNAVRIGMTAMLYRRGILLRPVDCARLAQDRGLSQLRVLLSNALHRLLQEPAGGSDFVRVRAAR